MLHKTRGIVFRFTKYGDTSIIVTIFTEVFGLQSYIVNGIRSKNAKSRIALFQPLTLLDLVVYYREHAQIKRIKEVKCLYPYQFIQTDVRKSAIAMFINELINKTVKEEAHAEELYEFIATSLITLDGLRQEIENVHLIFLIKLSRYLGFGVQYVAEVLGGRITNPTIEQILKQLLTAEYDHHVMMTNDQRREILALLISFYKDHAGLHSEMKSIQVLREILM